MNPQAQPPAYDAPAVTDLGTLRDITAGCIGANNLDESMKSGPGYESTSPAFGDPSFCTA